MWNSVLNVVLFMYEAFSCLHVHTHVHTWMLCVFVRVCPGSSETSAERRARKKASQERRAAEGAGGQADRSTSTIARSNKGSQVRVYFGADAMDVCRGLCGGLILCMYVIVLHFI